jgi:hypothetical protein
MTIDGISYLQMTNNRNIDYSIEDLVEFYRNKILLDWVKENHPEIIQKAEEFLKAEFLNKD